MENASKALIIAGAILISILLISVGIMIFNGSSGLFNSATAKMSDQEKQLFNSAFTMYEGTKVSASAVKQLIRDVEANNANTENPTITIDGTYKTVASVKNAYQYTVTTEKTAGVISKVTINQTGAAAGGGS